MKRRHFIAASAAIFMAGIANIMPAHAAEDADILVIELKSGPVEIALRPDLAPQHVERIKQLARDGAYDNVAFHRVIDGFMAQTGDVEFGDMEDGFNLQRAGTGGSSMDNLPAEFTNAASFERGILGMARSSSPNSANSQFFIMLAPAVHLDGQYTIVGEVTSGMENVDLITKGDSGNNGSVANPDRMISVKIKGE